MISAIWINPDKTTMQVTIDGVSSYVVRTVNGGYQSDDPVTIQAVKTWLDEGNLPSPGNFGGGDD